MLQLPDDAVRPPAVGSAVQVRWVDGNLYGAVFRGINDTLLLQVRLTGFFSRYWLFCKDDSDGLLLVAVRHSGNIVDRMIEVTDDPD